MWSANADFARVKGTWFRQNAQSKNQQLMPVRDSDYQLCAAAAVFVLADHYLLVDTLFKRLYMGDYAYKAVALGEPRKGAHCLLYRVFVQRAEALVHEHGIKAYTSRGALYLIGKSQSKGQGGLEGFSSRQCFYASHGAVEMVYDVKLQTYLRLLVVIFFAAYKRILTVGHDLQTLVCSRDYPVEVIGLYIGLKHEFALVAEFPVGCVGEIFQPFIASFKLYELIGAAVDIL